MKQFIKLLFLLLILSISVNAQTGTRPAGTIGFRDSSQIYVQEIINSKIPVLIDFWAVWCGPCEMLTPIINEIKKEYKGKIKVLNINVDKNRSLATYFRVVSIPNVFIVKDKIVMQSIPGVQQKEIYIKAIQDVLRTEKPNPEDVK